MSDQPAKPHVSPSQLDTLCRCGEQWRRRYIEGHVIPPGIAMLRGTGVHRGCEVNFRQKIETHEDLPRKQIVEAAVAGFEAELAKGLSLNDDEDSRGKDIVVGEAKDTVATLAEVAADELCPKYQPVLVEKRVRIELPGSRDIVGVIDMADDQKRVVDVKTSGKSKRQDEADGSVQLTTYAAMHKLETGDWPVELRLETLVSTKTPKLQTLGTVRGDADIAALAARIDAATAAIDRGVFTPAPPGAWWCSQKWCGYFRTCKFVNPGRGFAQGD